MTAQPRHAQDPYAQFYGPGDFETAAWMDGAEWATDPETREADAAADPPTDDRDEEELP